MTKVWSFNTTVRNPERMQNFLRTLKEFEGRNFDEECQAEFFASQIKKRLYKPTPRTLINLELIEEVNRKTAEEIPDEILHKIMILYQGRTGDAALRGRTTAGILNRFGLCIASKSRGKVIITELGNKWLNNNIDDKNLFLKFFMKWQYPNPLEIGYQGFNIKPFIGTLALISRLNNKWIEKGFGSVGISRKEFMLFLPSLIDYKEINDYVDKILQYRENSMAKSGAERRDYENRFQEERIKEIFDNQDIDISTAAGDLKDYTDSAIRYFRISEFLYLRGNDTHIDVAPDYKIEVEKLIKGESSKADDFKSVDEYINYLVDISLPSFPWENEDDLSRIKDELITACTPLATVLNRELEFESIQESIRSLSLSEQVKKLKAYKNALQIEKLKDLKHDNSKLDEVIIRIPTTFSDRATTVTTRPSLDLEWFVSLSLLVLNDAKEIKPSYKLGDDGLPTGFSSNVADIECLYESFGMIVEVTLLMGRDQWYAEGQPVMRHLRDFENKYLSYGESSYCVFIAPYIHRDTLNTFWTAIKGLGYEGQKQKIIPLRIEQYVKVLSLVKKSLPGGKYPNSQKYEELLEALYIKNTDSNDAYSWTEKFEAVIDDWGKSL